MRKLRQFIIIFLSITVAFVYAREEKTISRVFKGKDTIKINTVSGDCVIEKSSDSKIYVDVTFTFDPKRFIPEFVEGNGTLKIKEEFKGRGSSRGRSLWKIKIPNKLKVIFNSASGDLRISDLSLKLKSNTASGDFKLENLKGKVTLSTASGDLKLYSLKGNLIYDSASGDLKIKKVNGSINYSTASGDTNASNITGNIDVKTASGDINLDKVEGEMSCKTASGEIKIVDAIIKGKSSLKTASGDINLILSKTCNYDLVLSTASGDAVLDYNGNEITGFFTMITKKSNEDEISAPFNFDNSEIFIKEWSKKKMIKKTTKVKGKTPKIKMSSYSGSIIIKK